MEVRNDLVCHGSHTYTYSVATRLSRADKEKAPTLKDRALGQKVGCWKPIRPTKLYFFPCSSP
jgi:hypothetical protein